MKLLKFEAMQFFEQFSFVSTYIDETYVCYLKLIRNINSRKQITLEEEHWQKSQLFFQHPVFLSSEHLENPEGQSTMPVDVLVFGSL